MSVGSVFTGLLGWSNMRPGLEVYRFDEKIIPRHESEWGDLLVNGVSSDLEGSPVLLVVLDRGLTAEQMKHACRIVEDAFTEQTP